MKMILDYDVVNHDFVNPNSKNVKVTCYGDEDSLKILLSNVVNGANLGSDFYFLPKRVSFFEEKVNDETEKKEEKIPF